MALLPGVPLNLHWRIGPEIPLLCGSSGHVLTNAPANSKSSYLCDRIKQFQYQLPGLLWRLLRSEEKGTESLNVLQQILNDIGTWQWLGCLITTAGRDPQDKPKRYPANIVSTPAELQSMVTLFHEALLQLETVREPCLFLLDRKLVDWREVLLLINCALAEKLDDGRPAMLLGIAGRVSIATLGEELCCSHYATVTAYLSELIDTLWNTARHMDAFVGVPNFPEQPLPPRATYEAAAACDRMRNWCVDVIQPIPVAVDPVAVEWSAPLQPSRWATLLDMSRPTFYARIKDKTYRSKKCGKLYQLALADLPAQVSKRLADCSGSKVL